MTIEKLTSEKRAGALPADHFGFKQNRLVSRLREYGLTQLESYIYVGLLEYEGSTAMELSELLNVSRVEVYRILKKLLSRRIVSLTQSQPAVYQAVRPGQAFQAIIQEAEKGTRRLRELAPDLIMELDTLGGRAKRRVKAASNGGFRLHTGEATVESTREMVKRAQRSIQGVWSIRRARMRGLIRPFMHSVTDGVRAELICQITRENMSDVEGLLPVAKIRHCDGVERGLRFTIVDGHETTLQASTIETPIDACMSIWSDNEALIRTMKTTFRILWRSAVDAESRLAELRNT